MNCLVRADEAEHCKHQNWNDVERKKQPATQEGPHMRNQNFLLTYCEEDLRNGSDKSKWGGGSRRRTVTGKIGPKKRETGIRRYWNKVGILLAR